MLINVDKCTTTTTNSYTVVFYQLIYNFYLYYLYYNSIPGLNNADAEAVIIEVAPDKHKI